jgi:hypothetical protein
MKHKENALRFMLPTCIPITYMQLGNCRQISGNDDSSIFRTLHALQTWKSSIPCAFPRLRECFLSVHGLERNAREQKVSVTAQRTQISSG